jgi:hypothetical protein
MVVVVSLYSTIIVLTIIIAIGAFVAACLDMWVDTWTCAGVYKHIAHRVIFLTLILGAGLLGFNWLHIVGGW